jgi:hypothetical protein
MAPLWAAAGLVVPALGVIRVARGRKGQKEDADKHLEDADVTSFKCERVCTSNRLLKRLGGLAKVRHLGRWELSMSADPSSLVLCKLSTPRCPVTESGVCHHLSPK